MEQKIRANEQQLNVLKKVVLSSGDEGYFGAMNVVGAIFDEESYRVVQEATADLV
jgi:hypothetical protein